MTLPVRTIEDCIDIMRLATARRNESDEDSTDTIFLKYINDFIALTMTDDVKLFEQFDTLQFTIDTTHADGVYTFNNVGAAHIFSNISIQGFISLTTPPASSISWNPLMIIQNPVIFYQTWGVDNYTILIPGMPTEMLYYGTEMVFRTIPDTSYQVLLYGYKVSPELTDAADLPFAYWLRYVAYGAALNYARDFKFEPESRNQIAQDFAHERKLLLTKTHNQAKLNRAMPRF
jgi:hypothetical protein